MLAFVFLFIFSIIFGKTPFNPFFYESQLPIRKHFLGDNNTYKNASYLGHGYFEEGLKSS